VIDSKRFFVGVTDDNTVGDFYYYKEIDVYPNVSSQAVFANLQTANDAITSTLRYYYASPTKVRVFKKREASVSTTAVSKDQLGYMIIDLSPNQNITSTKSIASSNMSIYPNPAHDMVFFDLSQPALVQIYDLYGKLYMESMVIGSLDIHTLPLGTYLVKVDGVAKTKVVKL